MNNKVSTYRSYFRFLGLVLAIPAAFAACEFDSSRMATEHIGIRLEVEGGELPEGDLLVFMRHENRVSSTHVYELPLVNKIREQAITSSVGSVEIPSEELAAGAGEGEFEVLSDQNYHAFVFMMSEENGEESAPYMASTVGRSPVRVAPNETIEVQLTLEPTPGPWTYNAGFSVSEATALGEDGTIYVRDWQGSIFAIDPDTRDVIDGWEAPDIDVRSSPVLGENGLLYVGANDPDAVHAVDSQTGAVVWTVPAIEWITETPVVGPDGTVYAGTRAGDNRNATLYAIDNGDVQWTFELFDEFDGFQGMALTPDGTTLYATLWNDVVALDTTNGTELWSQGDSVNNPNPGQPSIGSDGTLYVAGRFYLQAIDPSNGEQLWAYDIDAQMDSVNPMIGDGMIVAGEVGSGEDQHLIALDKNPAVEDGDRELWRFFVGDRIRRTPVLGDTGVLYFGADNGMFYAVDSSTGDLIWSYETGDSIRSHPIMTDDGVVYIGSDDGNLYGFPTESNRPADTAWPMFAYNVRNTGFRPE